MGNGDRDDLQRAGKGGATYDLAAKHPREACAPICTRSTGYEGLVVLLRPALDGAVEVALALRTVSTGSASVQVQRTIAFQITMGMANNSIIPRKIPREISRT